MLKNSIFLTRKSVGPRQPLPVKLGLFPPCSLDFAQRADLEKEAEKFVYEGFATGQEALAGAVDILVEALHPKM